MRRKNLTVVSGSSGPLVPETPTRFFLGLEEVAQPARVLFESAGADPPGLDRGLNRISRAKCYIYL